MKTQAKLVEYNQFALYSDIRVVGFFNKPVAHIPTTVLPLYGFSNKNVYISGPLEHTDVGIRYTHITTLAHLMDDSQSNGRDFSLLIDPLWSRPEHILWFDSAYFLHYTPVEDKVIFDADFTFVQIQEAYEALNTNDYTLMLIHAERAFSAAKGIHRCEALELMIDASLRVEPAQVTLLEEELELAKKSA